MTYKQDISMKVQCVLGIECKIISLYVALPIVKAITNTEEEDNEQLQKKKP
jgi:hypothetical protein